MSIKALYRKEIAYITKHIKEQYKPDKIILFGSCATGNIKPSSDIDMFIIKQSKKRRVDRIKDVLLKIDNNLPFEPLVYTPDEVKERIELGDFFIQDILKKGRILYEKKQ